MTFLNSLFAVYITDMIIYAFSITNKITNKIKKKNACVSLYGFETNLVYIWFLINKNCLYIKLLSCY